MRLTCIEEWSDDTPELESLPYRREVEDDLVRRDDGEEARQGDDRRGAYEGASDGGYREVALA